MRRDISAHYAIAEFCHDKIRKRLMTSQKGDSRVYVYYQRPKHASLHYSMQPLPSDLFANRHESLPGIRRQACRGRTFSPYDELRGNVSDVAPLHAERLPV